MWGLKLLILQQLLVRDFSHSSLHINISWYLLYALYPTHSSSPHSHPHSTRSEQNLLGFLGSVDWGGSDTRCYRSCRQRIQLLWPLPASSPPLHVPQELALCEAPSGKLGRHQWMTSLGPQDAAGKKRMRE